jgi:hypothetical protein
MADINRMEIENGTVEGTAWVLSHLRESTGVLDTPIATPGQGST